VPAEPRLPSCLALWVLVATAVLAPWPYGAVQPRARLALTVVCLLGASIALLIGFVQGGLARPRLGLWPLLGFVGLGLVQLAPLPRSLLGLVAPGSSAVWYPASGSAAAVLGPGPRPVSLDPDTTLRATALVAGLALLAWIAAPALTRAATASRAVALVTAGGFCLSAYAIYARARFGVLLYGEVAVPTVRPFGSFVSKNHFAGYVELAALLAAGLAIGLVRRARESGRDWTTGSGAGGVIAAMVAALVMALAVIASLSRGGVISLAAGSLALLGLLLSRSPRARSRARVTTAVGLATALGVLLVVLAPPEAQERMRSLKGASFRLDTWRDTLRMAAASPVVGQGLGLSPRAAYSASGSPRPAGSSSSVVAGPPRRARWCGGSVWGLRQASLPLPSTARWTSTCGSPRMPLSPPFSPRRRRRPRVRDRGLFLAPRPWAWGCRDSPCCSRWRSRPAPIR
jgi:O-antigen ligase